MLAHLPLRRWIAVALLIGGACGTHANAAEVGAAQNAASALDRANLAFADNRMVAPAGNNALEWTLTARDLDPQSVRVREGLNDLYPLVVAAIERSIREGRTADAARVINLLERAMPGSLAARELRGKLERRAGVPAATRVASIGGSG